MRKLMPLGRLTFALSALTLVIALAFLLAPPRLQAQQQIRNPQSAMRNGEAPALTVFGPNVRANGDTTQFGQHEPGLAVSRTNPNVVFTAAKDYREGNIKRVWINGSTDGGQTWPVQLRMPNLPPTDTESDPVLMARDDGRIYVACLTTGNEGIWITWTDDNGATWQPSVPIVQNQSGLQDKDWFAIDNNPASPYYHRIYMMYAPNAQSIVEQHSTDGGLTWSPEQQISGFNTEYTYPVVASDGTVYNFMMNNWGFGRVGTVQMTKSTNGGVTWSPPQNVTTANQPNSPIRGGDNYRFFAILSAAVDPTDLDPTTRDLYVAWTDSRNFNQNGTDVVYVKSSNGGTTWGPVTRLSHDPAGVVRDHITPMLAFSADGRLHAFWLDRRLDPANRLYDSWYSSTTDGGATWEPDVRVSTVSQDLNVGFPPGSGNAAGDYWGLDVVGNTVYVAWNDTRSGDQDILVSRGMTLPGATPSPTVTVAPPTATVTPPAPSATATVPAPTVTRTPTFLPSPATPVPTRTATVAATPSPCAAGWRYADVPPGSTFYTHIGYMSCQGIMSGYACGAPGEPCDTEGRPYFRPNADITRGQLSKIVSNAAGFQEPVSGQTYTDVPTSDTFYAFIERLTSRGVIGGYGCGAPGEPCDPQNRPYFRPNAQATRGQISKIVANAAGFTEPVSGQTFEDVPPAHPFYAYIERLTSRGVMSGYSCGAPSEPCDPSNRPYFRPQANATRGQTSKIVANTFYPGCCDPYESRIKPPPGVTR
jgi:hypothetical protein